ncbi:hypothetical protein ACWEV3_40955 [Saccharopolyspora sp. NPDC003752]
MATRKQTRLDDHVDAPSTVQPGDAPADTTDPAERATSVTPDKAAAAEGGHLTVNAVKPLPVETTERDTANDRIETYTATRPDGTPVTITRNVETGESTVVDPAATSSE